MSRIDAEDIIEQTERVAERERERVMIPKERASKRASEWTAVRSVISMLWMTTMVFAVPTGLRGWFGAWRGPNTMQVVGL